MDEHEFAKRPAPAPSNVKWNDAELQAWSERHGVPVDIVKKAVALVGPMPAAVEFYIHSTGNKRKPLTAAARDKYISIKNERRRGGGRRWFAARRKQREEEGTSEPALDKPDHEIRPAGRLQGVGMATVNKVAARKTPARKLVARKAPVSKTASKKAPAKKAAIKRTLIEPTPGDKRYVRRDPEGKFKDVVDVGKSLSADKRTTAKTKVKPGQGDKGDVER